MLVPLTLGGALMTGIIAILMTVIAFVNGYIDDLLLFPATILSAALFATTAVTSVQRSPALVVVDLGAVLIIAGMTLVYLDRLVQVS